jgi:hypothetical protein
MFNGNPPRLVLREHLRLPRLGVIVARVEVGERLPVGVSDNIAAGHRGGAPGRREAAWWFCHGVLLTVPPPAHAGPLP